eukprot:g2556.t1
MYEATSPLLLTNKMNDKARMKVENTKEKTTTNAYQVKDDGESSRKLDINNIDNNLVVDGDNVTYLLEEIYPPLIAKFMKHIGGMISLGKNGKTNAKQYWVFWTITMACFCNFWGVLMFMAGCDPIGSFVLSFSAMPLVMPTCGVEINIFKSSYTGAIISREETRKKLTNDIYVNIASQIVFMSIVWGLPVFTIVYQYNQTNDLPIGLSFAFTVAIYFTPIPLLAMSIMGAYQEIVLLHQSEIISRIKMTCKLLLSILKDEELHGMEARKKISKVYQKSLKTIHKELRLQSAQIGGMAGLPFISVAQVFYVVFGTLDPVRSAGTGAIVIRVILYFLAASSCLTVLAEPFQKLAVPNNIWHDFTDTICKDPSILCLATNKFDGKYELLQLWMEKSRITFYLFGVSIDRYLPGKIFAALTSIAVSAGVVLGRMTGSF